MNVFSEIDPNTLVDSRVQLHWAAQVLSSAADATLEKAADDSHSNLGWDSTSNQLVGRTGSSIDVVNFILIHGSDSLDLNGKTLDDAMDWLGARLDQELSPREYEMPDHAVSKGELLQPNKEHLRAMANWFTFGYRAMDECGELRVWPHHFDLGFFMPDVGPGSSIGGGFSLGDDHYPLPYFYINPYGIDRPAELPGLENGIWTDKWFGAVITADEFNVADGDSIARSFVENSVSICTTLISN